ncbi:hypothetical protein [Cryptosporangium aurantiacum]|uniref:Uncharacterized protein n=1 Tax=Cryptosporangium aurantiacum TaxID=134849 RepID=A0A1M7R1J9_9ACTN|nr:hypothetical protein [Cryptosporangium aurantiacum]SHN38535.1 hypothetical protein SAMN05443668_10693 [Cryptosporangium aurantiacum]
MDESDRWTTLCQDYFAIRQASFAHELKAQWLRLAARRPAPLDEWWALVTELERLGLQQWNVTMRHDDEDGDEDDYRMQWDEPETPRRYRCPDRRCHRVEDGALEVPVCRLTGKNLEPEY